MARSGFSASRGRSLAACIRRQFQLPLQIVAELKDVERFGEKEISTETMVLASYLQRPHPSMQRSETGPTTTAVQSVALTPV